MRKALILLIILVALGCKKNEKTNNKVDSVKKDSTLEQIDTPIIEKEVDTLEIVEKIPLSIDTVRFLNMDYPFLDSAEKIKFVRILGDTIDFSKTPYRFFYDSLNSMNQEEVKKFYQRDSLLSELKENYLYPFFYGLSAKKRNFYPVLIVTHWGESAILSDYLLYDSTFQLVGLFTPSIVDLQPSYSVYWSGYFENDTVFRQLRLSETEDWDNSKLEYHDSSIYQYIFYPDGKIVEKLIESHKDTIIDETNVDI